MSRLSSNGFRPSNKEIKDALLKARHNVKQDKYGGYICNCLPDNVAGAYLRDFISNAIGDNATLGAWVWHNVVGEDNAFPRKEDMKAHRLRWIDYMLEGL